VRSAPMSRCPLVALLLALVACGDDGGSPPSAAGTVTYIVTACQQTGAGMTLQQEVCILHGDAEAVTAMQLTNARGYVRAANHMVEVETVDAFWSAPN